MPEHELRRLAMEALGERGGWKGPKSWAFVAAANPTAVLGLLDRIEELELALIEARNPGINMARVRAERTG